MKKIAFIISEFVLGGAERVLSELSIELARDHDITIIVFDTKAMYYEYGGNLINLNVPARDNGIVEKVINIVKRTRKLKKIIQKENFDYIYAFMESASWPAIFSSKKVNISIHCNPNFLSKIEQLGIKYLYTKANKIISISDGVADILRQEYGLTNVSRIYNPLDFEKIKRLSQASIENKEKYIIAVGRLNIFKRFDLLINAFSKSKTAKECQLLIFGSGELQQELQQLIESLNANESIKLRGYEKNPFKYMASAEFLVLSSDTEGHPMSLIEALALDCPVISTDCPTGPNEIITPEMNGLLVPTNDSDALTHAIDRLYFDKDLQQKLRKNAKKSVEHLAIENIKQQWLK